MLSNDVFYQRIADLRDYWLIQLEQDQLKGFRPAVPVDDSYIDWPTWRLKLIQSIREAESILRQRAGAAAGEMRGD